MATSEKIKELTTADFDEAINGATKPMLVDFYTPWCGPCKMIAPVLEELAEEMDGQVQFAKVNADAEIDVANKFGVRQFPTMLVFKDGVVAETIVGLTSKHDLASHLNGI